MKTQKELILNHLKKYKSITDKQAFERYGCRRLAAVIFRLRKSIKSIETQLIKFKTRYGVKGQFAKYVLK